MDYLHCRLRIPIPIRTTNQMSILYYATDVYHTYYAELFTLYGVRYRFPYQLLSTEQDWDWNRDRNLHL